MSYQRKQEDKRRLAALYNETRNNFGAGAYYDQRKERLIRYSYTGGGRGRYLKQQAARTARRENRSADHASSARAAYRRTFDYWWELF